MPRWVQEGDSWILIWTLKEYTRRSHGELVVVPPRPPAQPQSQGVHQGPAPQPQPLGAPQGHAPPPQPLAAQQDPALQQLQEEPTGIDSAAGANRHDDPNSTDVLNVDSLAEALPYVGPSPAKRKRRASGDEGDEGDEARRKVSRADTPAANQSGRDDGVPSSNAIDGPQSSGSQTEECSTDNDSSMSTAAEASQTRDSSEGLFDDDMDDVVGDEPKAEPTQSSPNVDAEYEAKSEPPQHSQDAQADDAETGPDVAEDTTEGRHVRDRATTHSHAKVVNIHYFYSTLKTQAQNMRDNYLNIIKQNWPNASPNDWIRGLLRPQGLPEDAHDWTTELLFYLSELSVLTRGDLDRARRFISGVTNGGAISWKDLEHAYWRCKDSPIPVGASTAATPPAASGSGAPGPSIDAPTPQQPAGTPDTAEDEDMEDGEDEDTEDVEGDPRAQSAAMVHALARQHPPTPVRFAQQAPGPRPGYYQRHIPGIHPQHMYPSPQQAFEAFEYAQPAFPHNQQAHPAANLFSPNVVAQRAAIAAPAQQHGPGAQFYGQQQGHGAQFYGQQHEYFGARREMDYDRGHQVTNVTVLPNGTTLRNTVDYRNKVTVRLS